MRVARTVNPNVRDGKLEKNFHKVETALQISKIEYDAYFAEGTGHAIQIGDSIRHSDYDLVGPVGGDGTVREVANGIRDSSKHLEEDPEPGNRGYRYETPEGPSVSDDDEFSDFSL